jgi:hypothetical protein
MHKLGQEHHSESEIERGFKLFIVRLFVVGLVITLVSLLCLIILYSS